ncbi:unnamed protein product [Durusdinium trenchii]|uniref:Uncharacterized protein n=1 Tax=Durusdinium trenchii TaxID=1381693 RepID=A0ABP0QWG0_9DINO
MEVDDDVWSIPSDDGMVLLRKSTAAPKKAARNQKHDDAARASRKAARLQAVAWKKEVAKATKFIGSLTSLGTQADSLQQKDVKFPTVLSPELKNGLEEAFKKVHTLKLRATALISATDEQKLLHAPVPLESSDEDNLRKAVRVRGASERAVYEIWNIAQEGTDRTVARGTFQQTVQRGLEPWTSAMHHVKFACADGPDIELPIINLQLCLTKFCSESADFQRALTRALNCSPTLTPILYADEATAGNVLAVNKKRKANLYYMSWVELWHFLKNQSAWLPVTVVQSTALSQIVGGASKVMVEILKLIVSPQNEEGFALSDNLFFKRRTQAWCLGNYDALRSLLSLKGSAGIRPCVYCINVVPRRR